MAEQYAIIIADTFAELEQAVDKRLLEGWRCQGGVAFIVDNGLTVAQAMMWSPTDE